MAYGTETRMWTLKEYIEKYEQLQAENMEVVMILGRYGRHDASCETEFDNPCGCGFDKVIEKFSQHWE